MKVAGLVSKLLVRADILRIAIILLNAWSVFLAQRFIAMDIVWSSFASAYFADALLFALASPIAGSGAMTASPPPAS